MELPILLALIFSPLAAAVAFVITYAEYAKHLVDRKKILKKALGMALMAFAFFMTVPPLLIWLFLIR
ncbi:MAG: hypothetical protein A2W20_06575 [Candidatus Aminicenantes bacterium RBG_16_66_30]|nr:MAG: hypothetical protein A2W20_06575 [Candidatus Aminicenantes bacterium RBG_16_66_30]